ncbi:hypothetical protein PHISP_07908 [Aspergillus sp. HF37]|nr:hypothetical protein PHISP_07908 [Aspergillus sp. HF37]
MPGFGGLSDSSLPSTSHDYRDGTTIASPQPAYVSRSPRRATDATETPDRPQSAGDKPKNPPDFRGLVPPAPAYMPSSPPDVPTYASVSPLRRPRWVKNSSGVTNHRERAMSDSTIRRVTPDPERIGLCDGDYSDSGDDLSLPNDYSLHLSESHTTQIDPDAAAKDKDLVNGFDGPSRLSDVGGPERIGHADSDSGDDVSLPPMNNYNVHLSEFDTAQIDSDATAKDEAPVNGSDDSRRLSAVGGPEHFTEELDYVIERLNFPWGKKDHVDERVAGDAAAHDVADHAVDENVASEHAVDEDVVSEHAVDENVASDHAVDENVASEHVAAHDVAAKDVFDDDVFDHERLMRDGIECSTSPPMPTRPPSDEPYEVIMQEITALRNDFLARFTPTDRDIGDWVTLANLRQELDWTKGQLEQRDHTFRQMSANWSNAIDPLCQQLEWSENQMERRDCTIDETMAAVTKEVTGLRNQFHARDSEKEDTIARLRQELSWTEGQLEKRDCALEETKKEATALRKEFHARDSEKEDTIARLRQELSWTEGQLEKRDCALEETKKEATALQKEFHAHDSEKEDTIARLRQELEASDQKNMVLKARGRSLEEKNENMGNAMSRLQEQQRTMKRALFQVWGEQDMGKREGSTQSYRYQHIKRV